MCWTRMDMDVLSDTVEYANFWFGGGGGGNCSAYPRALYRLLKEY